MKQPNDLPSPAARPHQKVEFFHVTPKPQQALKKIVEPIMLRNTILLLPFWTRKHLASRGSQLIFLDLVLVGGCIVTVLKGEADSLARGQRHPQFSEGCSLICFGLQRGAGCACTDPWRPKRAAVTVVIAGYASENWSPRKLVMASTAVPKGSRTVTTRVIRRKHPSALAPIESARLPINPCSFVFLAFLFAQPTIQARAPV